MSDIPRVNGIIRALEAGQPAFITLTPAEITAVQSIAGAPYDGVVLEMEHNPYDIRAVRDCFYHMLDRRKIADSGSIAPQVTPLVRIPPNGNEMNQWIAKQVLDSGAYGIFWPHVSTVEEARNAVSACRYTRPLNAPNFDPIGQRGDSPAAAARYWGMSMKEYYSRADVWPLDPKGEIFVGIWCEEVKAIKNLPDILSKVKGIGGVIIGESDLAQDLGFPRDPDQPPVLAAIDEILEICKAHNVPCGIPHVTTKRAETMIKKGFRIIISPPERTFKALETGLGLVGRAVPAKPAAH